MQNLTAWEQEWIRIQEELRQSLGVQVFRETLEPVIEDPTPSASAPEVAGEGGPSLGSAHSGPSVRFAEIGSQWKTLEPYQPVTGEFSLTPLPLAVHTNPPNFNPSFYSNAEQRIGADLRIIDDAPFTGNGTFSAVRLQAGVTDPEVWFSDHTRGLWKMDLNYSRYTELLQLTKGAFGWQHLFTQAPLDNEDFERTNTRIVRMLDVLPQIFPNYDYSPLAERLEARL